MNHVDHLFGVTEVGNDSRAMRAHANARFNACYISGIN